MEKDKRWPVASPLERDPELANLDVVHRGSPTVTGSIADETPGCHDQPDQIDVVPCRASSAARST